MPGRDERASGRWGNGPRGRISGAVLFIAALTRTLEAESDCLSLGIPVLFAGGISTSPKSLACSPPPLSSWLQPGFTLRHEEPGLASSWAARRLRLPQALPRRSSSIRSESVAETRGRRPWVPERAVPKPSLPAGQAYARDPGAADGDADEDKRFDGNPDE
jgi:hypothetical protein